MKTFLAILIIFCSTLCFAKPITEKHPNGKIKKSYNKDSKGWLNGEYKEYNQKEQLILTCYYQENKLHGYYNEFDENGKIRVDRKYFEGKKNGLEKIYINGTLQTEWFYINDEIAFHKSITQIQKVINEIKSSKAEFKGSWPNCYIPSNSLDLKSKEQNESALKLLMTYRYLCDVPYKDMFINLEYLAKAIAAIDIGTKNNSISHYPQNPGMPDNDYKFAYSGTSNCNLFIASANVPISLSIHSYMNDSDEFNRKMVGHRRWCLNPNMLSTGFASNGRFASMYASDQNNKKIPDFDYIAFPPKGYMPCEYFKEEYVWSVTLNPTKFYKASESSIKIAVTELDNNYQEKKQSSLHISYQGLDNNYIGLNSSCIIFKPENLIVKPKQKYKVEIKGLRAKVKELQNITYYIEFY